MKLTGPPLRCEVPDDWTDARQPGCVIATDPQPALGFAPTDPLKDPRVNFEPSAATE